MGETFKVVVNLYYDDPFGDKLFRLEADLPFVPTKGLSIDFGETLCEIGLVTWNHAAKRFHVESDVTLYQPSPQFWRACVASGFQEVWRESDYDEDGAAAWLARKELLAASGVTQE